MTISPGSKTLFKVGIQLRPKSSCISTDSRGSRISAAIVTNLRRAHDSSLGLGHNPNKNTARPGGKAKFHISWAKAASSTSRFGTNTTSRRAAATFRCCITSKPPISEDSTRAASDRSISIRDLAIFSASFRMTISCCFGLSVEIII